MTLSYKPPPAKVIHEFANAYLYRIVDLGDRYVLQVRGTDALDAMTWSTENKGAFASGLLRDELSKRGPSMWVWESGAAKGPKVPTRLIVRGKAITIETRNETGDGWVPFTQYIHARSSSTDAEMWAFVNSPVRTPHLRETDRFNIYATALSGDPLFRVALPEENTASSMSAAEAQASLKPGVRVRVARAVVRNKAGVNCHWVGATMDCTLGEAGMVESYAEGFATVYLDGSRVSRIYSFEALELETT